MTRDPTTGRFARKHPAESALLAVYRNMLIVEAYRRRERVLDAAVRLEVSRHTYQPRVVTLGYWMIGLPGYPGSLRAIRDSFQRLFRSPEF